jgi:hypothetical protein
MEGEKAPCCYMLKGKIFVPYGITKETYRCLLYQLKREWKSFKIIETGTTKRAPAC